MASKNYFQFKQFRVEQSGAAMKVCTDSCIFGAFVARWLAAQRNGVERALDIGTGTGLLSLMIAQCCDARIDAIELDEAACLQAGENFGQSPWKERLQVYHGDIRRFRFIKKYDFILCNPPFYEGDLKSSHPLKNQAKHATTLGYEELLEAVAVNLAPGGGFATLLPYKNWKRFLSLAKASGFYPVRVLLIRQTPAHDFFRTAAIFGQKKKKAEENELIIKDDNEQYTPEFTGLLRDYYLYL